MKIKYSDRTKEQISLPIIKALARITYTVLPIETIHIFTLKQVSTKKIQITHKIPRIGHSEKIIIDIPTDMRFITEPVLAYVGESVIYVILLDELE